MGDHRAITCKNGTTIVGIAVCKITILNLRHSFLDKDRTTILTGKAILKITLADMDGFAVGNNSGDETGISYGTMFHLGGTVGRK